MMKTASTIKMTALAVATIMLAACGGGEGTPEEQVAAEGIARTPQTTTPGETNLSRAGFGAVTVNNIQSGTTIQGGSIPGNGASQ